MSNTFKSEALEKVWLKALRTVALTGRMIEDEEPFLEIQNLQIAYTNAFETHAPHYEDIFGRKFLEYMQRVYSPQGDNTTGRNYYKLIHEQAGIDQVAQVIKKLSTEPLSRSATIILASAETAKQPCVTEINFSIRDSLVHMTIIFKSSDLAKKFIPDMVELSRIHEQISRALEVSRGTVTAHILCAQLYTIDHQIVLEALHSIAVNNYFKTYSVIENWDKEASEWDKNIQKPTHYVNIENGYSRFLDFLKKEISDADKKSNLLALDSGCGTGIIADILKNKGYKVSGVDISPQMLHFAHRDAASTKYVLANSLDLPYSDEHFDIVCSRGVLISHVGKKYVGMFLDEHYRVLKQGGLFMFDFITHFNPSESRKRRKKAYMDFRHMTRRLEEHGFEVLSKSGDDTNRVNAVLCRKINR